jgi:sirohydrochlorin ferrochelatase
MPRGVIVVDHGSRREASNLAFEAFVEKFESESGFDIVEAAHMEIAEPTIQHAFQKCVERGATSIVVCPFFLLPGRHWSQDIPQLTAEAAAAFPGVAFFVSAPIGGHRLLVDLLVDRIEHCARRRDGEVSACDVCAGSGGCDSDLFSKSHDASA